MTFDATFVALIAFSLFFALLIYLKIPTMILKALDTRAQEIAKELHDARRMREDAEKLLKEYEGKRAIAEAEAKAIVDAAKQQAAAVAEETRASMTAAMARRERQAEERIEAASAKATDEVRAVAAEAVIAAAEKLLRSRLDASSQSALVSEGVAELAKLKFG